MKQRWAEMKEEIDKSTPFLVIESLPTLMDRTTTKSYFKT